MTQHPPESPKLIHAHIIDHNSWNPFVKKSPNDRAKCITVKCSNSANCALYKVGSCAMLGLFVSRCPYGSYKEDVGPTKRAKGYGEWLNKRRGGTKDVPSLAHPALRLAEVGDYIYFNYPHAEEVIGRSNWIPKETFTVELIIKICNHQPRSIWGHVMPSYQQEEVPKFVKALASTLPDLYAALCEVYPRAKSLRGDTPSVGRKALLGTLNPNVGTFKDTHGGIWKWDGEYLTSENSHASFVLVKKFSEVRLKPDLNSEVIITDEGQVNATTEFRS